jgi:hypothetical protein
MSKLLFTIALTSLLLSPCVSLGEPPRYAEPPSGTQTYPRHDTPPAIYEKQQRGENPYDSPKGSSGDVEAESRRAPNFYDGGHGDGTYGNTSSDDWRSKPYSGGLDGKDQYGQ